MTTHGATSDDKATIVITFGFQFGNNFSMW